MKQVLAFFLVALSVSACSEIKKDKKKREAKESQHLIADTFITINGDYIDTSYGSYHYDSVGRLWSLHSYEVPGGYYNIDSIVYDDSSRIISYSKTSGKKSSDGITRSHILYVNDTLAMQATTMQVNREGKDTVYTDTIRHTIANGIIIKSIPDYSYHSIPGDNNTTDTIGYVNPLSLIGNKTFWKLLDFYEIGYNDNYFKSMLHVSDLKVAESIKIDQKIYPKVARGIFDGSKVSIKYQYK